MAHISSKADKMPASAIRKLVPLSDAAEAQGIKVYHLNIGAPDIKSPDCAMNAIKEMSMHHISYTNSAGLIELRRDMVEKYYKPLGIDIDTKDLLVTIAGSEAVEMSLKITCDPGDEVIVIEPYYTNYYTMAYVNGITLRAIHTDIRDSFKAPSIEDFEKVWNPKVKAVLLCNPSNPTGVLYDKESMLRIGEFCKKHDIFLISDEVYREFCYSDEPHFCALNIPGAEENVILVDSVSKRYNLCGARIGCIVSRNKEVMTAAMKYAQARLCPPVLAQKVTIAALNTPQEYFDAVKKEYIARRDITIETLNKMDGVFTPTPQGAFYTIAELPVDDAEDFARWMLEEFRLDGQTVQLTPAASFYLNRDLGKKHVRIAYVLEVPELKKALHVLEEGLKAYKSR